MAADEFREHAEEALDALADAVISTDAHGHVTYLNRAAETLTGWSRQEAAGRALGDVFQIISRGVLVRRDGQTFEIEDTATPIRDSGGHFTGAVIAFRDAGPAREASRHLSHLAHHDALTDLPNRLLLHDRLMGAIALAQRHDKPLAVLFVDVDGFKAVNDSLGHAAGDTILRSIGSRLRSILRRSDTVSRYSGDEFVVVLPELEHGDDAVLVARKLLRAASGPHRVGSRNVTVTVSVGIALYPDDGREAEVLIKRADAAMYDAKRTGPGSYRLFASDLDTPNRPAPAPAPRRRAWPPRTFPLFENLEDYRPGRAGRH